LILEGKTYTCKEELRELALLKSRLEQGIQAKEMFIKKSEEESIELDRKVSMKFPPWLKNKWTNILDRNQVAKLLEEKFYGYSDNVKK
jgi:hypothetical protein